jgi:hypothetical protein
MPPIPGILAMALGFCLAWAVCAHLPRLLYVDNFPVYRRQQLPAYAIFDPARAGEPKHAFVGSSYIINAWVANDLDRRGWPEIEDPQSSYAATAELVAGKEFGLPGQGFYDMGRPGPGFLDHIWYIDHTLRAGNLKTIIYANGQTGMYHFEQSPYADVDRACLEALYILEGWLGRFPKSAPAIRRYMDFIKASDAYRHGLERFGENWRERLDPDSVLLMDSPLWSLKERLRGRSRDATGLSFRGNPHLAVNKPAEMRDALVWRFSWLARLDDKAQRKRTLELLDTAARFYGDSRLDAPVKFNPPEDPFAGPEAPMDVAWTRMVGEVLQEAGVRLVWFFPPEVSIPPAQYQALYKPGVVDTVRSIIVPMGHVVSDHVVDHDLNQRDFLVQPSTDPPYGYGYKPSSIGKLKAVRLVLTDMQQAGALPGAHPRGGSCWAGQAALAPVKMCVRPFTPIGPGPCEPWPRGNP